MRDDSGYRDRVAELLDRARRARDPELAAIYSRLAMAYGALAEWTQRSTSFGPHAPDGRDGATER
jgi:hypothetical protein